MNWGWRLGSRAELGRSIALSALVLTGALTQAGGAALAALPNIDLANLGTLGFRINGIDTNDLSGRSVSGAGDVNGDGYADVVVGAPGGTPGGKSGAGEVYVVFGRPGSSNVDLSALGTRGFRIDGLNAADTTGCSVAAAGDVNGDGYGDIVIGAYGSMVGGVYSVGRAYVVFGKTTTTPVDLAAFGTPGNTRGFRIDGFQAGAIAGAVVAGAGDVNGDGRTDLLVSAPKATVGGVFRSGQVYVIFGRGYDTTVNLAQLGAPGNTEGLRIDGIDPSDEAGTSAAGAGDVNGDGLADILIGAPGGDPGGRSYAGEAYVVFGRSNAGAVDLAALGSGGFRVDGLDPDDRLGTAVAGAGDVNGDGRADVIVGAPQGDPAGRANAGECYVIFGKSDAAPVNAASLGSGGFRIDGAANSDATGSAVSGVGDMNGDGLSDILIGARGGDPGGDSSAGFAYVVLGKTTTASVDLAALGSGGFRIDGIDPFDEAGASVAAAGDVNLDGLADVIIGARFANPGTGQWQGESYVVYSPWGFAPLAPPATTSYRTPILTAFPNIHGVGALPLGADQTSHVDSRLWVDYYNGQGGDLPTPNLSTVTLSRTKAGISGIPTADIANVQWRLEDNRPDADIYQVRVRYTDKEIDGLGEADLLLWWAPTAAGPFQVAGYSSLNQSANTIGGEVPSLPVVLVVGRDRVGPTADIQRLYANPTGDQVPAWSINFSESIVKFPTIEDFVLTGTLAPQARILRLDERGNRGILLIGVAGDTINGTLGFELPAGVARDLRGNDSSFVASPTYTIVESATGGGLPGDLNGDGVVNVADITALGNHIANGAPLP